MSVEVARVLEAAPPRAETGSPPRPLVHPVGRARGERFRAVVEGITDRPPSRIATRVWIAGMEATRGPRLFAKSLQAVRRYGGRVAASHGISQREQLRRVRIATTDADLSPEEFYRYRLFLLDDPRDAVAFLSMRRNMHLRNALYRRLGTDTGRLADKRRFDRACIEAGLPIATSIASFDRGQVHWLTGASERLPRVDLFVKRADRLCGEGAARWILQGDRWRGEDGERLEESALIEQLRRLSLEGDCLLQARVTNHPALMDLAPAALCTVRVVTSLNASNEPTHVLSIFRMPSLNAAADNFAAGGVAAPIDPATGRLGPAARKALADAIVGSTHHTHPDTKAPITGRVLPDWERVIPLCLTAHRVFGEFLSVGWDVALTEHGPLLIEGNFNWDVVLAQQPALRPLAETDFAEELLRRLESRRA